MGRRELAHSPRTELEYVGGITFGATGKCGNCLTPILQSALSILTALAAAWRKRAN